MKSIDVGRDFSGQLANGPILNFGTCPGKDNCPHEHDEDALQSRFAKNTGIACSSGAREVLEHLVQTGVFSYEQLAVTWRARSLFWDIDDRQLKTDYSRLEMYGGMAFMTVGLLSFILGLIGLVSSTAVPMDSRQIAGCVFLVMAIFGVPFFGRSTVRPNRLAKSIEPYLKEYYAPH